MSYDLSIWCLQPFDDPEALPPGGDWSRSEGSWCYRAKTWMLNAGPSDRVLDEDIPDGVIDQLPGIEYMVSLTLEPLGAPRTAYSMLRRVARLIARRARGVIYDPQDDSIELPRGLERYRPPRRTREERFGVLDMSWWMNHDQLLRPAFIERFLALLETHLPEALPRRYGDCEPPQHLYTTTGRSHLVAFLVESLARSPVWYAHPPIAQCQFMVEPACGWRRMAGFTQYHCNHLTVSVDARALAQPGWPTALRRFWRRASELLQPFFGEVRTLHGYLGGLPQLWSDSETETNPTWVGWWKGVPPRLGHAVVIGEPYLGVWPQARTALEPGARLAFASTDDWSAAEDVSSVLPVPEAIALPFMPYDRALAFGGTTMCYPDTYPEVFPLAAVPEQARHPPPREGLLRWKK